jgi:hypothetical protein
LQNEEGKSKIIEISGEIRFEGHFDSCFDNLKETQQESLILWIGKCVHGQEIPKRTKDNEVIAFVYRIGSNLRAILTKEKNGYFIALFLDKHKYYETEIEKLGI